MARKQINTMPDTRCGRVPLINCPVCSFCLDKKQHNTEWDNYYNIAMGPTHMVGGWMDGGRKGRTDGRIPAEQKSILISS